MISNRIFRECVRLDSRWCNRDEQTVDRELLRRTQQIYGDQCCSHGYVYGDTIIITNRGDGVVDVIECDGAIIYDVEFVASVCMPGKGELIGCMVQDKNREGIRCEPTDANMRDTPLDIILPIRWHDESVREELHALATRGRKLMVRVIGTRFSPGERRMSVIVESAESLRHSD